MNISFAAMSRYLEQFLLGALQTLWLTLLIFALVVALSTLVAIARHFRRSRVTYAIATVYVEALRNVPALVVLYLVYFGLPQFGILLENTLAGVLVLTIVIAAYLGEALRGALDSIPAGQWEAADSLALTRAQTLRRVMLPQVFRAAWPSVINHLMIVLFATSLLSVIDVRELASAAAWINSKSFRPFETYIITILIYLALATILQLLGWQARRLLHGGTSAQFSRFRRRR